MARSFHNVGVKEFEIDRSTSVERTPYPIGLKTPIEFSSTELFKMHTDVGEQIADNLKNLLLTNHGERVGRYLFGANLQELTAEFSSQETFEDEALLRINTAVQQWMPFVELLTMEVNVGYEHNRTVGHIELDIMYSVPRANLFNKHLLIVLYVI